MRRIWLLAAAALAVAALAAGPAAADIVYLRGGTMLQGRTSREGDMIVVHSDLGDTKVPLTDVVHIVPSEEPAASLDTPLEPSSKPAPASRPAPGDLDEPTAPPPVPVSAEGAVNPAAPEVTFAADRASIPDTQVFAWERVMARMAAGAESYYLRQEIDRAKGMAHERKRRVGLKWLGPREFAAHRAAYAKKLAEAEEIITRAGRPEFAKTDKEVPDHRALMAAGNRKLQEAADMWADPLLRRYLLGLATLWGGQDPDRAAALLGSLTRECPLVAWYQQASGMALMEQKRALTALGAYVEMMRLRPDPRGSDKQTITDLVEKAMHQVPGYKVKSPIYQMAQELVEKLKAQKNASGFGGSGIARKNEITLLMPDAKGRSWQLRGPVLPVPPYDRLVFRQAVGVPIGPDLMLVDAKAAADAMEIYVQIDSRTVAPAQLERPRTGEAAAPALTLLRVKGYAFRPLTQVDPADLTPNASVVAFATDFYSEMGNRIRTLTGKVVPDVAKKDAETQFTMALAAGEGTAPVLMGNDVLVGFLTGRIDTAAARCGLSKFIPTADLAYLFKSVKSDRGGSVFPRRPGAAPRAAVPAPRAAAPAAPAGVEVAGKAFLVYFIVPEVLE